MCYPLFCAKIHKKKALKSITNQSSQTYIQPIYCIVFRVFTFVIFGQEQPFTLTFREIHIWLVACKCCGIYTVNLLLHTVCIYPHVSDEFSHEQQIGDLPGSETRLMELHLCRKVQSTQSRCRACSRLVCRWGIQKQTSYLG